MAGSADKTFGRRVRAADWFARVRRQIEHDPATERVQSSFQRRWIDPFDTTGDAATNTTVAS